MSEKLIELAKKLRELAQRGIGGEKTNAERLLAKIMSENGISLESLESIKRGREQFRCKVEHRFLLIQIAHMILGSDSKIYRDRRGPSYIQAECTAAEQLEIEAVFDFYKQAYEADLKVFRQAFIQRNQIFPSDGEIVDIDSLSGKEKELSLKARRMAAGMDKHHIRKQLEMTNASTKGAPHE